MFEKKKKNFLIVCQNVVTLKHSYSKKRIFPKLNTSPSIQ